MPHAKASDEEELLSGSFVHVCGSGGVFGLNDLKLPTAKTLRTAFCDLTMGGASATFPLACFILWDPLTPPESKGTAMEPALLDDKAGETEGGGA